MTEQQTLTRLFSRRNMTILLVLGGAVALLVAGQTWVTASNIPDAPTVDLELTVLGQDASPVVTAMALVAIAAGVALTLVRTIGRIVIGVLMIGDAILLAWATSLVIATPEQYILPTVSAYLGLSVDPGQIDVSVSPIIAGALFAALLIFAAGLITLVYGHRWDVRASRKYENTASAAAQPLTAPEQQHAERIDEIDAWDDLSRGEDPTDRDD